MATFASLSLTRRAVAALNVIDSHPGLTIAERHELVSLAVWPSDMTLPGLVRRDDLEIPNVDQRRAMPAPPPAARRPRVSTPITTDTPAVVRTRYLAGASIAELADEYGVPWLTARAWTRGRG